MLLLKAVDGLVDLAESATLVQRQTHDTTLLGNGLQDALANPPDGVGNELEATGLVELLGCLDQADVTLVNKVGQRQALMLILLGHTDHEAQVGLNEPLLGSLPFGPSTAHGLGQFNLFIDGNQRRTAYFHKVFIQCLTRAVGDALLYLQLSHNCISIIKKVRKITKSLAKSITFRQHLTIFT